MTPMLASMLEQMENQPSAFDNTVISHASSMAITHIRTLEGLVRTLIENEPDEPIADGGHVVLDLWRQQARLALGIEEPDDA